MYETLKYYLGTIATRNDLTDQAMTLREQIFSAPDETSMLTLLTGFFTNQTEIYSDTVALVNTVVMPAYGSEFLGAGGSDWIRKGDFFKMLISKFPGEYSFKFYYADCACMAGAEVGEFYSILEEGMVQDKSNKYYPSSELFETIAASEFSFQFDLLLLDKYRQPCSKEDFDDYLAELMETYKTPEQIDRLNKVFWKG